MHSDGQEPGEKVTSPAHRTRDLVVSVFFTERSQNIVTSSRDGVALKAASLVVLPLFSSAVTQYGTHTRGQKNYLKLKYDGNCFYPHMPFFNLNVTIV